MSTDTLTALRDLPATIASAFDLPDSTAREGMICLRRIILDVASELPEIGRVTEELRWGQPAYLTPETGAGSSLRIGTHKAASFARFVHCRSRLIPEYLELFPGRDRLDGTRAVLFNTASDIDPYRHGWLARRALTYHLSK